MPSYREVMKQFLLNYSYQPEEPYDRVILAKKKKGWYVTIVDQLKHDSVKNEQLFWSVREDRYHNLEGFGPGRTQEEARTKMNEIIYNDASPSLYGYERCRYFGYNTWDVDMIRDFGAANQLNDTLLEGLGRACGNYAERFMWYSMGGHTFDKDPLKQPLKQLELPGRARIDSFLYYINRSVSYYEQLDRQNPGYKLRVGTPMMKILNEQLHEYHQLLTAGYEKEAKALVSLLVNDSIYNRIGRTYLDACPANSILITYGDNDTYPLWYIQEKEGYRKDVTVVNNSLLGLPMYVNRLKKTIPGLFTTDPGSFGNAYYDYFSFDAGTNGKSDTLLLATLIHDLQTLKYRRSGWKDTMAAYRTKNIVLPAEPARLKQIADQSHLDYRMDIQLKDYLLLNELLILDILQTNIYTRPIYLTAKDGLFSDRYLQEEGPVYRILPLVDDSLAKLFTETVKTEHYLESHPDPVIVSYSNPQRYYENALYGLHTRLYSDLISAYTRLDNREDARKWVDRYFANPAMQMASLDAMEYTMVKVLLDGGYDAEAVTFTEKFVSDMYDRYRNPSAAQAYYSIEDCLPVFRHLAELFREKNIKVDALDRMIRSIGEK